MGTQTGLSYSVNRRLDRANSTELGNAIAASEESSRSRSVLIISADISFRTVL